MNEITKAAVGSRGFEEAGEEDLVQPRIKLAQGMSPVVTEGAVELGNVYNSITQEAYGSDVILQPIFFFKSRIKWLPRTDEQDIDCQASDAKMGSKYELCLECDFRLWGEDKGERLPPPCTEIYNFLSIVRDNPKEHMNGQLVVISYMKTTWSEGRHLLSKMRYSGGDMFSKKYKISSRTMKNKLGEFYVYGSDAGVAASEDEHKEAIEAYKNWFDIRFAIEVDMTREEETKDTMTKEDTAKPTPQESAVKEEDFVEFK